MHDLKSTSEACGSIDVLFFPRQVGFATKTDRKKEVRERKLVNNDVMQDPEDSSCPGSSRETGKKRGRSKGAKGRESTQLRTHGVGVRAGLKGACNGQALLSP